MRSGIPNQAVRAGGMAVLVIAACATGCSPSARGPHTTVIAIRVTEDGFVPRQAFAPRGTPVTLLVTRMTDQTCVNEIVIAGGDSSYALPLYRRVRIELPHGIADTLRYACAMDMFHGLVIARSTFTP